MKEVTEAKRYMVFSFGHYYPNGGLDDCEESFDTLDEARGYVESHHGFNPPVGYTFEPNDNRIDWQQYIFDRIEGKKIVE